MIGNIMGSLLKTVVKQVQERNNNNPKVKTADNSVFENILEKFKQKQNRADNPEEVSYSPAPEEFCDDLCNELDNVQQSNEADPNVETADASVFEDMKKQLEELKAKVATQSSGTTINSMPLPDLSSTSSAAASSMMATTNSNKGSLGLRATPDMGAAINHVRIPEFSKLKVLGYSDNSIVLDGAKSRFAKVQFGDQVGWVLESYLSFD